MADKPELLFLNLYRPSTHSILEIRCERPENLDKMLEEKYPGFELMSGWPITY